MKLACKKGCFIGIKIDPNGDTVISHLFNADDALFIGEWNKGNIKNMALILRCFHVTSGLKVNFHKSRVFGIVVDVRKVSGWEIPLGCE